MRRRAAPRRAAPRRSGVGDSSMDYVVMAFESKINIRKGIKISEKW